MKSCSDMCAGLMRNRVQLQRRIKVPDGGGGYTHVWETFAVVWAYIKPLSGNESLVAMQLEASVTHDVIMRHRPDLAPEDRVVYKTRAFHIRSVINIEERNRWLQLRCEEGVAQ